MNLSDLLKILIVLHQVSEAISVSGEWGDWGDWTGCSVTCGYGTINRSRNWIYVDGIVTNFTFVSFLQCWTKIPCPIHGGWNMWTSWSECSLFCGNGTKARIRECTSPEPSDTGFECNGDKKEVWNCNEDECPDLPEDHDITLCNKSIDFMCVSGRQCVPMLYRCDGEYHCHDGSDEGGCYTYLSNLNNSVNTPHLNSTWYIIVGLFFMRICTYS